MAVNPLTLLDGTTAFATDVEAKFNPLYTDMAPVNVGASNKTGTGKFVLDTNPVLTSPTITGFTSAQHTHASAAQGGALDAIGRVTFDAQGCVLPTTAPNTNRSAALVSGVLQIHDGTSAKSYLRTDTYNESSVAINFPLDLGNATDANFVDVGGAYQIVFTVNVPGRYMIIFEFQWGSDVGRVADRFTTLFRITDGTNNGKAVEVISSSTNQGATEYVAFSTAITITEVFNYTTTGSKTVKLQKRNYGTSAVGTNVLLGVGGVSTGLYMKAFRIAD